MDRILDVVEVNSNVRADHGDVKELDELQLTIVGGGIGDTILV